MSYVNVAVSLDSEIIEVPVEDDGTLSFDTIRSLNPETDALIRVYRKHGHFTPVRTGKRKFYPPEDGWGEWVYYCAIHHKGATKRKVVEGSETSEFKSSEGDSNSSWAHTDLVVKNLPRKTGDKESRDHFSKFGDFEVAQFHMRMNYDDKKKNLRKKLQILETKSRRDKRRIARLEQNFATLQLGEIATELEPCFKASRPRLAKFRTKYGYRR